MNRMSSPSSSAARLGEGGSGIRQVGGIATALAPAGSAEYVSASPFVRFASFVMINLGEDLPRRECARAGRTKEHARRSPSGHVLFPATTA